MLQTDSAYSRPRSLFDHSIDNTTTTSTSYGAITEKDGSYYSKSIIVTVLPRTHMCWIFPGKGGWGLGNRGGYGMSR